MSERIICNQFHTFFEDIFSKFRCGFRKGYSTQAFGALMTDLSKAFDYLRHDLLVAKLHAYVIDLSSLKLLQDHLSNHQHMQSKGSNDQGLSVLRS